MLGIKPLLREHWWLGLGVAQGAGQPPDAV
jgi:hypothetical protein